MPYIIAVDSNYKVNKSIQQFYANTKVLGGILFTVVVIILWMGYQARNLEFDFDFESFFPENHPDRKFFEDFKDKFHYDNDFLTIAIENEGGVFQADFLQKVESVREQIQLLEGTNQVICPTKITFPVKTSIGFFGIQMLDLYQPDQLTADSIRLTLAGPLERSFFNQRFNAISIRIKHRHFKTLKESSQYLEKIHQILLPFDPKITHIIGRINVQQEFTKLLKTDFGLFLSIAFLVIVFFLWFQFRTLTGILAPLLVIVLSVIFTLGLIAALGLKINVFTILIPTILSFVALSSVIHFFIKYHHQLSRKKASSDALEDTIREIGLATFLTSFTTAIGFLSLSTISVAPIRHLGMLTAAGVMITFILTLLVLPFWITLKPDIIHLPRQYFLIKMGKKVFRFSLRNQRRIIVATLLIILTSYFAASNLQIDARLIDDLPEGNSIRNDFYYFDKFFGGSKPWNLVLQPAEGLSIFSLPVLQEAEKIELYVLKNYKLGNTYSPVSKIKFLNQIYNGGIPKYYKLPASQNELDDLLRMDAKLNWQEKVFPKVSSDGLSRISGFIAEYGSHKTSLMNQELMRYIDQNIKTNLLTARVTGSTYLIDLSHKFLSINLLKGLLLAFLIVGIMAAILFRSVFMTFVTLFPNVLPILITAGVIGLLDIPIKLTTSIVFTIAFGIAVDDTIHFISKFRIECDQGKSLLSALVATMETTGHAMIITTGVLCSGFAVFCFSSFEASFFMGLFISVTLLMALAIDITLLPILLHIFYPNRRLHRIKKT